MLTECTKEKQEQTAGPDSLSPHFEEELLIDDEQNSEEPLLVSPAGVRTDRVGNIYIADRKQSAVQVFDADGNFLRSIGRAGAGPGEFGVINAIEINNKQELMTIDANNKRVTRFSNTGEVLSNYAPAEGEMIWSQYFRQLDKQHYLLLHKEREIPGTKEQEELFRQSTLFHLYDSTFTHTASFGRIDSMMNLPGDFTKLYANTVNSGHFWPDEEGNIWYAPPLYAGRLFKYRAGVKGWTLAQTLRGHLLPGKPLEIDSDREGNMTIVVYTDERTKSVSAYLKSESLGIFEMNDGRLIHLSSQLQNGKRKTVVEVFNEEGKLEGVGLLEKFTFAGTEQKALITNIWKDKDDRFYIIDKRDVPVVRVGRIEGVIARKTTTKN
ncbi:6-bladed beta-propeller [Fodinibius salsisoli]|uniref:6-bladed beta-propeller n=1 Tax=Fodinibius salsisoli TaxID=2820877 RepID=A0ABT3PJT0_9BACT|nr:6-bladed beta-propeller [Fodinibius salsisoli]MCW9706169.1 6-bladed beta-propeller [Fodinibius salsisoli]